MSMPYGFTADLSYFKADEYFCEQMRKVMISNGSSFHWFCDHRDNACGGKCYQLSIYALMGLKADDVRAVGLINTFPRNGYKITKDYRHAWVEFRAKDDKEFVYDPLQGFVIPKEIWYEACQPRFDSRLTQKEIIEKYIKPEFAYFTDKGWSETFVFKNPSEAAKEDEEEVIKNGYIFSALSRGTLVGYFADPTHFRTSSFLARN